MNHGVKRTMSTKHTHTPNFGRRITGCPRCAELIAGAPARLGWGAAKRVADASFIREIREHDCKARGCGPVCTFGDW
jgi:hypothetical protein